MTEQELHRLIAEQNVIIDTLRTTLNRVEQVVRNEKDKKYVFTKASKWAMTVDMNDL